MMQGEQAQKDQELEELCEQWGWKRDAILQKAQLEWCQVLEVESGNWWGSWRL